MLKKLRLVFVFVVFLSASVAAETLTLLVDGDTAKWRYHTFGGVAETEYSAKVDDALGGAVLFANSDGGASGYVRPLNLDLQKTPWLHFRWRVDVAAEGFDERQKSGDDFPFRLYFVARHHLRYKTLTLVKTQNAAKTAWTSPYSGVLNHLRIYAFAGDDYKKNVWHTTSLNLLELWRRQFNFSPTLQWAGLMTDADSANGKMQTRYGDIILSDNEQPPFF